LRELLIAADARRSHEFDAAAHVMCLIANVNRDTKHRRTPYAPAEFHPWHAAKHEAASRPERIKMSRSVFRAMYRANAEKTGAPIPESWSKDE